MGGLTGKMEVSARHRNIGRKATTEAERCYPAHKETKETGVQTTHTTEQRCM